MQAAAAVSRPHLLAPSPLRARSRRPSTVCMAHREDSPSVAIVGATGAVGQEFLRVISDRDFPYRSLLLLASERSAGKRISFEDREYTVQDLAAPGAFEGVDIALFSAGGGVSHAHAPAAVASGAVVVDNSSAFRMDPEVPLVIPKVNPEAMSNVRLGQGTIVANPNCSTIICLMAATPLHRHAKVLRMVVSTYQAASGAGAAAMEELKLQTQEVLEGKAPTCNIFNQQYAFNISQTRQHLRLELECWPILLEEVHGKYDTNAAKLWFPLRFPVQLNLESWNCISSSVQVPAEADVTQQKDQENSCFSKLLTNQVAMDPLPKKSWYKGNDPSIPYITKLHNIANNFKLAMELAHPAWKDDIFYWRRKFPTWVPKTTDWKLEGFLVYSFMWSWNGVRLPVINTRSHSLRTNFLVDILKSSENECKDIISGELQDLLKQIRN